MGRRGRSKRLLDYVKEKRALDNLWRTRCGKDCIPVVRQIAE
jgi:hypothetical protein